MLSVIDTDGLISTVFGGSSSSGTSSSQTVINVGSVGDAVIYNSQTATSTGSNQTLATVSMEAGTYLIFASASMTGVEFVLTITNSSGGVLAGNTVPALSFSLSYANVNLLRSNDSTATANIVLRCATASKSVNYRYGYIKLK